MACLQFDVSLSEPNIIISRHKIRDFIFIGSAHWIIYRIYCISSGICMTMNMEFLFYHIENYVVTSYVIKASLQICNFVA